MQDIVSIADIPDKLRLSMKSAGIWRLGCPVSMDMLKLLTIKHHDFAGNIQTGEMVVLWAIAEDLADIFTSLFKLKFSIHKIALLDVYLGDDELSMLDNNSSCFNFRNIAGSRKLSMHSYGLAVDINPMQNPYITKDGVIHPRGGEGFVNRSVMRNGMVEAIIHLFKAKGFEWGGDWLSVKDYHHFQRNLVTELNL